MLQQGRPSGYPCGDPNAPEYVNVFANASPTALQMRLIHDRQDLNEAGFRSGDDERRELPVNKLGLERVAVFLESGSNQEGNRAAEA